MTLHYIKIAFRNLLKYKTQNLISTIGLAVGLLCFSICLYSSRYMQKMDQCFENYSRLVDIQLLHDGDKLAGTPASLIETLRKKAGNDVEAYTRVAYSRERSFDVYLNDEKKLPYTFQCIEVDSSFNQSFTPTILAGKWQVAASTPNAVVLTESMARKIFSRVHEAIGKRIVMTHKLGTSPETTPRTGGIAYTIQVVISDIPTNISMNFMQKTDAFILNDSEGVFWNSASNNDYTGTYTYALLHKGQNANKLNDKYHAHKLTHNIFNKDCTITASAIGKNADCSQTALVFSLITGLVGTLIFLVALLNFFHFQLGSMLNRRHEFSIRKVLGNNTMQLSGMLFTQLFFVIVTAFLFTMVLIELLASQLQLKLFRLDLQIDKHTLMWQSVGYFIWILLMAMVICIFVALYIRRTNVRNGISYGIKNKKNRFRNFMQGVQFFICWLFVSMATALYLQSDKTTSELFSTLSKAEKRSILSLPLDYTFMKNNEKIAVIDRIRQHSGIKDILLSDISYLNGVSGTGMQLEKDNQDKWIEVNVMQVNPNFREFMNIPLLSGKDMESGNDMYVDDRFGKQVNKEVLGTLLYNYNKGYIVCGILSSFIVSAYSNRTSLNGPTPYVFIPSDFTDYVGHCYIKCHTGREKEVSDWITKIMQEVLPENIEPKVSTFLDDINEAQALETKLKDIILFFSIVCLIITLLGVFAAITLDTERRQKEVAIRKVNGAGVKQIIYLFMRLYIWLLVITAILSFPIIYFILQMWRQMYQIFFNDGILYWGGIFFGISLLTTLTIVFRIVKIARLNPAKVIKNE